MDTAKLTPPQDMEYEELCKQFLKAHEFINNQLNIHFRGLEQYRQPLHPDYESINDWFIMAETELRIRNKQQDERVTARTAKKQYSYNSESYINRIHEDPDFEAKNLEHFYN